jgi:hypothetical protein
MRPGNRIQLSDGNEKNMLLIGYFVMTPESAGGIAKACLVGTGAEVAEDNALRAAPVEPLRRQILIDLTSNN